VEYRPANKVFEEGINFDKAWGELLKASYKK